jgi:hypothetical protein
MEGNYVRRDKRGSIGRKNYYLYSWTFRDRSLEHSGSLDTQWQSHTPHAFKPTTLGRGQNNFPIVRTHGHYALATINHAVIWNRTHVSFLGP